MRLFLRCFSVTRRWALASAALLASGVIACAPDHDLQVVQPPVVAPFDTTAVVPAPTPYQLRIPAALYATARVPADNPLTNEGVELGRFLFYEKRLSVDNSISCASCHQQDKAFTDGRPVALGVAGARGTRNAMSLANIMWVDSLNWDRRFPSIETQNRLPIENPVEMHQSVAAGAQKLRATLEYPYRFKRAFGTAVITEERILKALGQFQRTLISGQSRFDRSRTSGSGVRLTAQEEHGYQLFTTHPDPSINLRGGNCGDCHGSIGLFKSPFFFASANNGLDSNPTDPGVGGITGKARDMGVFAVPSLRNIELTAPYMHDGRFQTLEEVLDQYNDHVKFDSPNLNREMRVFNSYLATSLELTPDEKRDIIAFLKTLTDTTFTHDPRFADPN